MGSAFIGKNMAKGDVPPLEIKLPSDFIRNILTNFPGGAEWLERLPELIDEAARRWNLVPGDPFLLSRLANHTQFPAHLFKRLETIIKIRLRVCCRDHHADARLALRDGREAQRHRKNSFFK